MIDFASIARRSARWFHNAELLLVLVVAVLGVASRFHRLDADSLWLDESITYMRSSLPLDELLEDTIKRLHLPGYFVLMHYWMRLGDDEFMMRAPAAAFGGLGVIAAIVLGWVLAGRRGAWVLGMLCALSPALLRYSQEARMYSQFVLATIIGMCGLLWLVKNRESAAVWPFARGADANAAIERRRARRAWIAFAVGVIGAIYSHNTGVFFWAACWLVAGFVWLALPGKRRPFLRNWLLANVVVLIAWTPWLKPLLFQTKTIAEGFWVKFPSQAMVVATLGDLFLLDRAHWLPGAAVAAGAVLGLWAARRNKVLALALLILALAPPAMILIVSLQRPIWIPRIMLWCAVPFFALCAYGIASLRSAIVALMLAGTIAVSGVNGLFDGYYSRHHKPRWEKLLRYVQSKQNRDSTVLLIGEREVRLLRYYTERRTNPIPKFKFRWTPLRRLERNLKGHRTAWLIAATNKPNVGKVLRAMPEHGGKRIDHRKYGYRLQLFVYRVKPRPEAAPEPPALLPVPPPEAPLEPVPPPPEPPLEPVQPVPP